VLVRLNLLAQTLETLDLRNRQLWAVLICFCHGFACELTVPSGERRSSTEFIEGAVCESLFSPDASVYIPKHLGLRSGLPNCLRVKPDGKE